MRKPQPFQEHVYVPASEDWIASGVDIEADADGSFVSVITDTYEGLRDDDALGSQACPRRPGPSHCLLRRVCAARREKAMTLTNLRRFYEQVTPEALEAYLDEHGWTATQAYAGRAINWTMPGYTLLLAREVPRDFFAKPDPEQYGGVAPAIGLIAAVEQRQPTAVLFDLLPASARPDFVREILPGVAE